VAEVVPGGVGGHEAARDVATGVIIDGEQQDLFVRCPPPLVDGTVVLPEFADVGAAETPVRPGLALRDGHKMCEVRFDISFDIGACALETAKPLHFIGHELIVGWVLQGQEAFEEGVNVRRPRAAMVSAAGFGTIAGLVAQERRAQLVEPRTAYSKVVCGCMGVEVSSIEVT